MRDRLDDLTFWVAGSGEINLLPPGELTPADHHQNWGFDEAAQRWRIDVMLESGDADTWVSRRGGISAPRSRMVARTAEGIPYLKPEGVLLYKAKATRPKDEADFAACLPRMTDDARAWLVDALTRAHPGHDWIARAT